MTCDSALWWLGDGVDRSSPAGKTSVPQVPTGALVLIDILAGKVPGYVIPRRGRARPRLLDLGGGKYEKATEVLKPHFDTCVFDPINREPAHNAKCLAPRCNGGSDAVLVANVLNVLPAELRATVLHQAMDAVRHEGLVLVQVYLKGTGKVQVGTRLSLEDYATEAREHFDDVVTFRRLAGRGSDITGFLLCRHPRKV